MLRAFLGQGPFGEKIHTPCWKQWNHLKGVMHTFEERHSRIEQLWEPDCLGKQTWRLYYFSVSHLHARTSDTFRQHAPKYSSTNNISDMKKFQLSAIATNLCVALSCASHFVQWEIFIFKCAYYWTDLSQFMQDLCLAGAGRASCGMQTPRALAPRWRCWTLLAAGLFGGEKSELTFFGREKSDHFFEGPYFYT